ncbi:glycosyltransferase family 2 protein [Pseudomonas sp. PGPR40]|uniref:glycosyltransferase family 2 protein n=1 Tax=Pseudomonas sp. PGPR40 TaxID=2913476 RepID=UPI001EDC9312|nr:glycosyltransferase family A protein [Pseudomonas sp. PGPR40]
MTAIDVSQTNIKYSIVIPTFNRSDITRSSVYSILNLVKSRKQNDFEIIIVNDGSTDDTQSYFERASKENECIRLINTDKLNSEYRNPGFARNAGVMAAKGRRVCFCDGDIIHLSDPLGEMDKLLSKHGDDVYVTGIHYRLFDNRLDGPRGVNSDMPHGSWLSVERKVLLEIGGYDQRFKKYGNEDQDIVQRLRRRGLKHVVGANIIAIHPRFDAERSVSSFDQVAKDIQIEFQRDISVQRNIGQRWGGFSEADPRQDQVGVTPSAVQASPVGSKSSELGTAQLNSTLTSLSESLMMLAENKKSTDKILNLVNNIHRGYVSVESAPFERKKHKAGRKEVFDLMAFGESQIVATDHKPSLAEFNGVALADALELSCDVVILSELHRQRNVGSYLDRALSLLKTGGVCIVFCPAYSNNVGSGNTSSLWNAGYLLYNLILAGFDCKSSKVSTFENEIQLTAYKSNRVSKGGAIGDLSDFFPMEVYQHFNGNIKELNWFKDSVK